MGRLRTVNRQDPPRFKRGRKQFYYDHGIINGKRTYEPLGADEPLALKMWAEIAGAPAATRGTTFGDAAKRYERDVLPTIDIRTRKDYALQLPRLVKVFGRMALETITTQHVLQFIDRRSQKVEKDGKITGGKHAAAREVALFSTVFNHARAWGYTSASNPRQGIRLPKAKRDTYVTDAQYRAIYDKADEILRDAMDLAYCVGQRPGDTLRIMRTDIRDDELWLTPSKTRNSSRKKLRIAIEGELELVLERITSRPRKITSLRLFQRDDGSAITLQALERRWVDARQAAGIEPHLAQFRDLRAKAATDLDNKEHAQRLLGHTTVVTTEVYTRDRAGDRVLPLNRKVRG